jgi:hypothetical protein
MSGRAAAIDAFLARAGWAAAARADMPADASARHYVKLAQGGAIRLLMDAPPPEDVRAFVAIARHLRRLGLNAPEIFAADEAAGLVLLAYLGDTTLAQALAAGAPAEPLYRMATDALIALHRHPDAAALSLPAYDAAAMLEKARLFPQWYLPAFGRSGDDDAFARAWMAALPSAQREPPTLVHRDFFPDNLMLAGPAGSADACGIIDFQDAGLGPRAYDLVSLLEDARRDVAVDIRAAMTARYLAAFPGIGRADFATSWAICAAQRHTRVLGIFVRLARRDGKPGYLVHIPRLWRLLEAALLHPALAPVREWFDAQVPPALRRIPERAA